jgi:hypothetical protein
MAWPTANGLLATQNAWHLYETPPPPRLLTAKETIATEATQRKAVAASIPSVGQDLVKEATGATPALAEKDRMETAS